MAKRDPKTGRFVRTKPDYKALYEEEVLKSESLYRAVQQRIERLEDLTDKNFWLYKHASLLTKWRYKRRYKERK